MDKCGTIETGKLAYLPLLNADRFESVENARDIAGVLVKGQWLSRDEIDLMSQ